MRIDCPKCGADHAVLESDFFLRCPYCEARIVVDPPESTPHLTVPSVDEERVRRLFPPDSVLSVEIRYFPYLERIGGSGASAPTACFNQPWQELERYVPPAGDRKIFDEMRESPEELIPFDREQMETEGGRILFHPFYIVMLKKEGYSEGMLVDGVSGMLLGEAPGDPGEGRQGTNLARLFLTVLLAGLVVCFPVYYLLKAISVHWTPRMFILLLTALASGYLALRVLDRREGE